MRFWLFAASILFSLTLYAGTRVPIANHQDTLIMYCGDEVDVKAFYARTEETWVMSYSTEDEHFEVGEGMKMSGEMTEQHTLIMVEDTYYIKCYDIFDNVGGMITVHNV